MAQDPEQTANGSGRNGKSHVAATAVVTGRPGLSHDVVALAATEAGLDVIDLRDRRPVQADVALLVDPMPVDWQAANRLADRVVLVTPEPIEGGALADAIRRGADAVVDLTADLAQLVHTVRQVAIHGTALTTSQARTLIEALRGTGPASDSAPQLSRREHEVLHSITRGESVKQTARALGISVKTVENLQSRLHLKLGVRNRAQAVARAYALGLLPREAAQGDDGAA